MEPLIGLFVNNLSEEYHRINAAETEQAARQFGISVEVFDAKGTTLQQGKDIHAFVKDRAEVSKRCALVTLVSDRTRDGDVKKDPIYNFARRVLQRGVGWITINHGREDVVSALRAEFPSLPVSLLAIDNVEFGRIQARQVGALVPGGGTVLCVLGNIFDSACWGRTQGFREELAAGPFVIAEVDARWDENLAESAVYTWMSMCDRHKKPPRVVVCQNDPMGLGARRALARVARGTGCPELSQIPVIGGDGLHTLGQRWVDDGKLTATVAVRLAGKVAVQLLAKYWRDGEALPAKMLFTPQSYPALSRLRPGLPQENHRALEQENRSHVGRSGFPTGGPKRAVRLAPRKF